jgi:hypothetical protein
MGYSGARGTLIYEKNLKAKILCQTPFKAEFLNEIQTKVLRGFYQCWGSGIRCLFDPLDPGSGIGFFRIPDLGSQTQILGPY